jgi:hypothetical protein
MFKMFKRVAVGVLVCLLAVQETSAQKVSATVTEPQSQTTEQRKQLTEAAVIALLIAGSVAAYKALGRPCACPKDRARDGSVCGGRSAWSRAGGYKPLCFPTDVTAPMIQAYRANGVIPPLR